MTFDHSHRGLHFREGGAYNKSIHRNSVRYFSLHNKGLGHFFIQSRIWPPNCIHNTESNLCLWQLDQEHLKKARVYLRGKSRINGTTINICYFGFKGNSRKRSWRYSIQKYKECNKCKNKVMSLRNRPTADDYLKHIRWLQTIHLSERLKASERTSTTTSNYMVNILKLIKACRLHPGL